jgi:integrase
MTDHSVSQDRIQPSIPPSTDRTDIPKMMANLLNVKVSIQAMNTKLGAEMVSALHAIARGTLAPASATAQKKSQKKHTQEELDAALARISVHARHLVPLFDRRVGARLGFTRAGWRNAVSLTKKALKASGAWALFKVDRIKLSPEWQTIADRSPRLSYIRLLGHWAMLFGISPADLNDAHLPQFLDWLLSWKTRDYSLKCYFSALSDWNKGANGQPDWPGRSVMVETRLTGHYTQPRERWSPELRADVTRVIDILRHPDLDEEKTYDPIPERTAIAYEGRLFLAISAYVAALNIEPLGVKCVETVLDPHAAKLALDFQLRWAQRKTPAVTHTSQIHGSAKLLATIADRCYDRRHLSAEVVLRLQKMARVRCPVRKGMTPKNRQLLNRFDDEELQARFYALPYTVAARILKRGELRRVDEVHLMLAFAVAQSIEAPLRPEDQAALIDGVNVFKTKTGKLETLAIRTTSRKTGVDLDFELSGEIVGLYDTVKRVARNKLCAEGNPYVFPGPGLGPKAEGSLSQQITHFVEDEIGIRLTGQQFRHVIGYLYLKANPSEYETVRQLLGHTDITTTMAFYASMDMRAASKKVSAFVAQKRRELAPLLRPRSPKRDLGND